MTNRFLISVAAVALIAGTGLANAQGCRNGMQRRSTAQQSAPSSERGAGSSGAMQHDSGGTSGMKGAETGTKGARAWHEGLRLDRQDGRRAARALRTTTRCQGEKSKSMHSET